MIVSRAPVRLTVAGGGTDVEAYYRRNGGFLIAAALDKYIWISANRGYYDHIHLKYSGEERVKTYQEIKHPIFRQALSWFEINEPIELISSSDVPAGCGLGTSSSFTVALCRVLEDYKHRNKPIHICGNRRDMAEIACFIEIDLLEEPIGKQDQYASAFGGINCYTFNKDGGVKVEPLKVNAQKLNDKLLLFDTGVTRRSSYVWTGQKKELEADGAIVEKLNTIMGLAYQTKKLLETGKLDEWGELLNEYWVVRKQMSPKVSTLLIDEAYDLAIKNGALGGKLQGAGGGGFLMFYCPEKEKVRQAMAKLGLREMPFSWDYKGVQSFMI